MNATATQYRTDADNIGLIGHMLTYYDPNLDRTEFSEYKYAQDGVFLTRSPSGNIAGIEAITRQRATAIGQWKLASDYVTNLEAIDFTLTSVTYGAKYFQAKTRWSSQELDRMAAARAIGNAGVIVDVVNEKMMAVDETYMQLVNRINALGLPALNIYGLHTHPDIPRMTAPYALGLAQTATNNLAVLSQFSATIRRNTSQKESPDTLLLPTDIISDLSLQVVSTAGSISTLQYFVDNDPYIDAIDTSPELDTAGPGGTRIAQAYKRDPSKVDYMLPKEKTQIGPTTFRDGVWENNYDAQLAGVHFKRPYSSLIMEGV